MMRVLTVEEMVCVSGGDTFVDLSAGLDSNPDLSVFVLDASGSGGSSASLPGGLIGVGGHVFLLQTYWPKRTRRASSRRI